MKTKHPLLVRWIATLALPLLIWLEFPDRINMDWEFFRWKWYPWFWEDSPEYCIVAWSLVALALLVWIVKPRTWSGLLLYFLVNAPWHHIAFGYVTGARISNIQIIR